MFFLFKPINPVQSMNPAFLASWFTIKNSSLLKALKNSFWLHSSLYKRQQDLKKARTQLLIGGSYFMYEISSHSLSVDLSAKTPFRTVPLAASFCLVLFVSKMLFFKTMSLLLSAILKKFFSNNELLMKTSYVVFAE